MPLAQSCERMFKAIGAGLVFGIAAVVLWTAGVLLGEVTGGGSLPLAFVAVAGAGWGAGYMAAKWTRARPRERFARGLTAGTFAGLVAFVGTTVSGLLLATILQRRVDLWLARLAWIVTIDLDASAYLRGGGLATGLCFGLVNLLLMSAAGAFGGWIWRR